MRVDSKQNHSFTETKNGLSGLELAILVRSLLTIQEFSLLTTMEEIVEFMALPRFGVNIKTNGGVFDVEFVNEGSYLTYMETFEPGSELAQFREKNA